MNNKNLKIYFLLFIVFELSCDANTATARYEDEAKSIDTSQVIIDSSIIDNVIDTLSSIKDHCFILENIIPSGEDQYRRVISFNENNQCNYKVIEANSTAMGRLEILDGRNSGVWKLSNDTIYIQWDAYYTRIGRDNENWGKELRYKRFIEGKYKVTFNNTNLSLQYISERITSSESDGAKPEYAERLFYNDGLEGLFYNNVNCEDVDRLYMVKNFIPKRKSSSNRYLEDYNRKHSCNDQRSFDAGYDLARDQIGNGLLADADYLYSKFK